MEIGALLRPHLSSHGVIKFQDYKAMGGAVVGMSVQLYLMLRRDILEISVHTFSERILKTLTGGYINSILRVSQSC